MKHTCLSLKLSFVCLLFSAIAMTHAQTWLTTGSLPVSGPGFIDGPNIKGEEFTFKTVLETQYIDLVGLHPSEGDVFSWTGIDKDPAWRISDPGKDGFHYVSSAGKNSAYELAYHAVYVSSDGLNEYQLEVESPQMFEIYLDGKKKASCYQAAKPGETSTTTADLALDRGKFLLVIKSLFTHKSRNSWMVKASIKGNGSPAGSFSTDPSSGMDIHHLLEGTKLRSVSISPDASLVIVNYSRINTEDGKRHSWSEVKETASGRTIQSFRKAGTGGYRWMPRGQKLYYTGENEHGSSVIVFDFASGKEYSTLSHIQGLSGVHWSGDEETIIYGIPEEEPDRKQSSLLYMDELGNRTFRTAKATSLYRYDVASGVSTRLTYGEYSTSLEDISRNGEQIIFSVSKPNDTLPPFTTGSLYLMDLETGETRTIYEDEPYGGSAASFSPDEQKIMVVGGPDCFGETGRDVGDEPIALNYDSQIYIYDIPSGAVESITLSFNPSVNSAWWHQTDGNIYFTATDGIYRRVFKWTARTAKISMIPTGSEVITGFSLAGEKLVAAYAGSHQGHPSRAWILDLQSLSNRLFDDTEVEGYRHVRFGQSEEWDFVSAEGNRIRGWFIYPMDFDPDKKYPLIVNYYGGVSPVEKGFGGRYPQDIWACEGYVVYVPQPSGAIGFGQEFSARHQNNWGITVADEIIEGTKKFIESHPFVDAERVGCIGASYGGFMTMLLQTRTDMFTCAISHAGISSISSYWGEGYWGYWYNTVASRGSYPWNRKDIYVGQSPLFSADKVTTPLLLLHGSKDVNVPLGESLQMWVGLKILGKPVEMVQVEGEGHHILTYSKRIEWHNTIMAWFDKWLKDKGGDWYKLFPDSRL